MANIIKWARLNHIAEQVVARKVTINLSTSQSICNFKALAEFNDSFANIFLNGNECESDNMVIKAISHELAHVVLRSEQHGSEHSGKWDEINKEIREWYFSDRPAGVM